MNWFNHSETLDRLASEYVLGTLNGLARQRFERLLGEQAVKGSGQAAASRQAAQYVARWQEHWLSLDQHLPAVTPDASVWNKIAARTVGAPVPSPSQPARTQGKPPSTLADKLREFLGQLFQPIPAMALACGLFAGVMATQILPQFLTPGAKTGQVASTQLPESYVGVLATDKGATGLIISSLRRGQVVDIKRITAVDVPQGKQLYLWGIDSKGLAFPIAPLPEGPFVSLSLDKTSEEVFAKANELAVSVEPLTPGLSMPSSDWVYRGLCGKLWKVPPKK